MSMHEYVWRMNEEELNDEWVCINLNAGWTKKNCRMDDYEWMCMEDEWRRTKGWMSIHEMNWGWIKMN